jgi:PTH1 family peptidyl-tRNA hydrolase
VLGDFAKADREWLEPLLDAIADNADKLVAGDDNGFMNKVSLAVRGSETPAEEKPARKSQSHIRQARPKPPPKAEIPEGGPMATMLRKLLGGKD